jgi:intracellular sulfur oxidation DsrE/DsrF family protein
MVETCAGIVIQFIILPFQIKIQIMRKQFSLVLVTTFFYFIASAQSTQKIVFDFVKADTADFRVMVLQIKNVLKEDPNTAMEVVCYGPGLMLLVSDKTNVSKEMEELQKSPNVIFAACANTMRRLKVEKSQLVPFAKIIPVAMLELSKRQQEGWSYIKAGF